MKLAAAHAIAGVIPETELGPEYIIPSVFNRTWRRAVADAVARRGDRSGHRPPRAGVAAGGDPDRLGGDGGLGVLVDLDEAQVVLGDLSRRRAARSILPST